MTTGLAGRCRGWGVFKQVVEDRSIVDAAWGCDVFGLDAFQGLLGNIGMRVQHRHQIAVANDANPRYLFGRRGVDGRPSGAVGRGAHDFGIEHARKADIAREFGLAGDFFAGIAPQIRLAADGVFGKRLQIRHILQMPFVGDDAGVEISCR